MRVARMGNEPLMSHREDVAEARAGRGLVEYLRAGRGRFRLDSSMYRVVTMVVRLSHRKSTHLPSCSTLTVPPSAKVSQSPSLFYK
jgi:hypothetical protein